jgi:hypothetical protein
MAPEYDIPVLENEEMWSQRVIDEHRECGGMEYTQDVKSCAERIEGSSPSTHTKNDT